jgi:hypothetical protein
VPPFTELELRIVYVRSPANHIMGQQGRWTMEVRPGMPFYRCYAGCVPMWLLGTGNIHTANGHASEVLELDESS